MKYIRRKYNLTQKQLAKQVGVSVSAISAYETGKYDPSCAVLIRFICIFDVSADFLLGLSERDAIILHLENIKFFKISPKPSSLRKVARR